MPTISTVSAHLGAYILRKQNLHFGHKISHFRHKKKTFRPEIGVFEDFDALKCNFLSFFSGIAIRVRTLTKYFGYIQVKISYGTKKNSF